MEDASGSRELEGRTALVTGGAKGIGRALVASGGRVHLP